MHLHHNSLVPGHRSRGSYLRRACRNPLNGKPTTVIVVGGIWHVKPFARRTPATTESPKPGRRSRSRVQSTPEISSLQTLPSWPIIAASAFLELADWYQNHQKLGQGGDSCTGTSQSPPAPICDGDGRTRSTLAPPGPRKPPGDVKDTLPRRCQANRNTSSSEGGER